MTMELVRFLGGALVLFLPGIWLAGAFSLGKNFLERCAIGSSIGLGAAVYLAWVSSHIDLRLFYLVWAVVAVIAAVFWLLSLKRPGADHDISVQIWMGLLLILVAVIQYSFALPRVLPAGSFDARFHLILAKQIQLTHHAIDQWPFVGIRLNYPTGSHVLVVVLSGISGLPVHTVFKDLIPLLAVLTTAQIYVLARRISGDAALGLYSAGIYGLWAWAGGIDYFRWGGLPNQLGMLLLIAALSTWLGGGKLAVWATGICLAAMILVHHHVMMVAAIIVGLIVVWMFFKRGNWKPLFYGGLLAIALDLFFLLPYALRVGSFQSTGILNTGEPALPLASIPRSLGYAMTLFAVIGIALCAFKYVARYPVAIIASSALIVMYALGEYVVPAVMGQKEVGTFFTPSRFLTDLNYFLPIFAASTLVALQRRLRASVVIPLLVLLVAPVADMANWTDMAKLYAPPPEFLTACDWIHNNTAPDTIVDDPDAWSKTWTTYLCWRRGAAVPIPISEPTDFQQAETRIPEILAGRVPPDSPDQEIVAIRGFDPYTSEPVLWTDAGRLMVVREWPLSK